MMYSLPADFMARLYLYFLDLLFFILELFHFEVFGNFHVFALN